MSERIFDITALKVGDVVTVATKTRKGHWWKRFAVVTYVPTTLAASIFDGAEIELKHLELDMAHTEARPYDLETAVVTLVPNEQWPQGVSAMYAKALAKGWIELG